MNTFFILINRMLVQIPPLKHASSPVVELGFQRKCLNCSLEINIDDEKFESYKKQVVYGSFAADILRH